MFLPLLVGLLFGVTSDAKIRTVHVNADKMKEIRLSMGNSTVLRFLEKPRKVVVGNKNYFNIEFINNDVTIQPLANAVKTNLFVYGQYHVYGFLLRVCGTCSYDDKVDIRWKSKTLREKLSKEKKKEVSKFDEPRVFWINGVFKVTVENVQKSEKWGIYFIDLTIKNGEKFEVPASDFKFWISRSEKKYGDQKFVFEKDSIKSGETIKGRFLLKLKEKKGFSLNGKYKDKQAKTIISRRYL